MCTIYSQAFLIFLAFLVCDDTYTMERFAQKLVFKGHLPPAFFSYLRFVTLLGMICCVKVFILPPQYRFVRKPLQKSPLLNRKSFLPFLHLVTAGHQSRYWKMWMKYWSTWRNLTNIWEQSSQLVMECYCIRYQCIDYSQLCVSLSIYVTEFEFLVYSYIYKLSIYNFSDCNQLPV